MRYEEKKYYVNFLFSIAVGICILGILLIAVSQKSTAYIHTPDKSEIASDYYPFGAVMPTANHVYYSVSNPYYGTFIGYHTGLLPKCPGGVSTIDGSQSEFPTAERNLNGSTCNTSAYAEDANYYYFLGHISIGLNDNDSIDGILRYSKADSTLDTTFRPLNGLSEYAAATGISDALIAGNYLYVGGGFSFTYNAVTFKSIFRIDLTTKQIDTTWNPTILFTPSYGYVFSLAADGTYLYIGGSFNTINGTTRNGLGRILLTDGTLDTWNPNPGAYTQIRNIRIDGGYIYIVSNKSTVSYATNPAVTNAIIVRFSASTGLMDETWSTAAKGNFASTYFYALEISGGYVYLAGGSSGGTVINRLAVTDGSLDATWNSPLTFSRAPYVGGGEITALAVGSDGIFIYGDFLSINGNAREAVAKLSIADRSLTTWVSQGKISGTNQQLKIKIWGNTFYHSDISVYNPTLTGGLRRLNKDTLTVDTSWQPTITPDKANITAMAKDTTYVYMGGLIETFDTEAVTQLFRINATTGALDTTFKPNIPLSIFSDAAPTTHEVTALTIAGNYLYVGGTYTPNGSSTLQGYVVRVNLTTLTPDTSWGPVTTDDAIKHIAVKDTYVYVAGWFYSPLIGVLRADTATGTVDATWDLGLNEALNAMSIDGDYMYIGTDWGLTQVLGQSRDAFAKIQISTKTLDPFTITLDSSQGIMSLLPVEDTLCVFGYFMSINAQKANGFACVNTAGVVTYNRLGITNYVDHKPVLDGSTIYLIEDSHIGAFDLMFNISGLPAGLGVFSGATDIKEGSNYGAFGPTTVALYKNTAIIAAAQVSLGSDKDWSGVTADSDSTNNKAFVTGLRTAPGVSSYSLYIPRDTGNNTVRICPNATSLASTTTTCTNGVTFTNGQTKNVTFPSGTAAVTVTQVTVSSVLYWKADGVLGTGGMSYYVAPITPTPTPTPTATPTPTPTISDTPIVTETPTSTPQTDTPTPNYLDVDISNEQNQGNACPTFTQIPESPVYVKTGTELTIAWETTNAKNTRILGINKTFEAKGSTTVTPTEDTMYVLIAENDSCSIKARIEVRLATYLPTEVHTATVATLLVLESVTAMTQSSGIVGNIWLSLASFVDRRRRRYSGIVFDSKSKRPVPRAVVRLISVDTNEIVDTVVTDAQGVFKLIPSEGTFKVTVTHPQYTFPSQNNIAFDDKATNKIYLGENISVRDKKEVLLFSIPIDPVELNSNDVMKIKIRSLASALLLVGSFVALLSGLFYSMYATLQNPKMENYGILLLFLLVAGYKYLTYYQNAQRMGKVTFHNDLISNLELGLFDPEFDTLLYRAFTDTDGQYLFVVPSKNSYILKILDTRYTLSLEGKPMDFLRIEGGKTKQDVMLITSKLEVIEKS